MRYIIIAMLAIVVVSLFSGLFFIYRDRGQSNRAVKALTVRIVVSVSIMLLLIVAHYFGLLDKVRA